MSGAASPGTVADDEPNEVLVSDDAERSFLVSCICLAANWSRQATTEPCPKDLFSVLRTLMTMIEWLRPYSTRTEAVLEHEVPRTSSVPFVVTFAEAPCGIFWISESTGPCHANRGLDSSNTCKLVPVLHVS